MTVTPENFHIVLTLFGKPRGLQTNVRCRRWVRPRERDSSIGFLGAAHVALERPARLFGPVRLVSHFLEHNVNRVATITKF